MKEIILPDIYHTLSGYSQNEYLLLDKATIFNGWRKIFKFSIKGIPDYLFLYLEMEWKGLDETSTVLFYMKKYWFDDELKKKINLDKVLEEPSLDNKARDLLLFNINLFSNFILKTNGNTIPITINLSQYK